MKKQIISYVIMMALMFTMLSACGRETPGSDDSNNQDNQEMSSSDKDTENDDKDTTEAENNDDNNSDEENDQDSETESSDSEFAKGQELSEFVSKYTDEKSKLMDAVSAKIEESGDLTLTMSLLGFAMADLSIAFVPMFDVVDEAGFIPFLGLKNAYRKENGNLITFGADFVRDEENGNSQKDDREFWEGKLDVKDESLQTIYYTERGGKKISQTVIEITKNKDASYTSEMMAYTLNDDGTSIINGYFINFEGENLSLLQGNIEGGKPDFSYESVFGKKNADIKSLAKDFTIETDITFIDGVVKSNIEK